MSNETMNGRDDLDATAEGELRNELADHLRLVDLVWASITVSLAAITTRDLELLTNSRAACLLLLCRIANDLHCIHNLARHGHAEQSAALAASVLEVAYTIAYIGADDRRGADWWQHANPATSYRSVGVLITATTNLRS